MATETAAQPQPEAAQAQHQTQTKTAPQTKLRARMTNPAFLIPEVRELMLALDKTTHVENLPGVTRTLVHLRASQINGCSVCVDMHARELKHAGQSDQRIFAVAAWRDTPYFTDAERAALELTEYVTRLSDRPDPVPDAVWDEAARHYDERALAGLIVSIAAINVWNRFNVSIKQPVGAWK